MEQTREGLQNGYWTGGEVGGVFLYPLTLDRLGAFRTIQGQTEDGLQLTRVGLACYAMTDEEAARNWTPEELEEEAKKYGNFPIHALREFEQIFSADMAAIQYSETDDETTAESE
tara:strand:+ start:1670 stop:2014 length:345 start_codon:yes stop_codon:yes gene_type:complete